ncbi:hypothetical protein ABB55_03775 [Prosthecomicrobium hirschii]|uniref:YARHG domain-containing protein n=1 Tax=Prosthecodimorpha hirschii TaxID=665126 RepID=A0A0P6VMM8_9HYPH|nr:hypothetical protein [Prosthecomicrobium hirschii]KPL51455.1 hypothetical protein ABB55_03775 [Prosthecomicrobium hirschii]
MLTLRSASLAVAAAVLGGLSIFAAAGPAAAAGAYGPDTCRQGYVWRESFVGDTVCVTPAERARAKADNFAAKYRVNPSGGAYGRDTCRNGYVWREAFPGDHVCVTPAQRARARHDNARANGRYENSY